MAEPLSFSTEAAQTLEPYLPPLENQIRKDGGKDEKQVASDQSSRPFVTLTFATSLDSSLALAPGTQTVLSGAESKAMTHFLRSRHDAICVGVGTAEADDPGLNCRLHVDAASSATARHPRPVIIDPQARWDVAFESKVLRLARSGQGLAPFVITAVHDPDDARRELLEGHGGKYIFLEPAAPAASGKPARFEWSDVLRVLAREGIRSVMIEGGGSVINSLLQPANHTLIDAVIVTIAPTWLGRGGVVVSPNRALNEQGHAVPVARLKQVSWHPLGEDVVLCGTLRDALAT